MILLFGSFLFRNFHLNVFFLKAVAHDFLFFFEKGVPLREADLYEIDFDYVKSLHWWKKASPEEVAGVDYPPITARYIYIYICRYIYVDIYIHVCGYIYIYMGVDV